MRFTRLKKLAVELKELFKKTTPLTHQKTWKVIILNYKDL